MNYYVVYVCIFGRLKGVVCVFSSCEWVLILLVLKSHKYIETSILQCLI